MISLVSFIHMTEQVADTRLDDGKKYRIGEVIGVGGFGLVYEAYDLKSDQKVVIKVLKRKNKEETFKKEINIMKQIQHPSVISLLDTFRSQESTFCAVMNFAENGSILSDIMRNGTYSEEKMRPFMKSILEGLDAIHQQGIIHNDIKAANILINKGKAIIADFGASIDTKVVKNLKSSIGSPHWMSPETASGRPLSVKSDIWSIGILAIEMLTGKPPLSNFPGSTVLLILKQTKKVPFSLNVSDICLSFIKMCLQSNPKYRPNAADLLYHPFFMEMSNSNSSGSGKKSSIYVDLASKIADEKSQSKITQILNDNQEKILCSLKNIDEIINRFILFETIALFSKENNDHLISSIIEYLLKFDTNLISFNEVKSIILLLIGNIKNKDQMLNEYNLFDFFANESVKKSPLAYIVQEQLKGKNIVDINDALSFISCYQYDIIYLQLIKTYQKAEIPRRLRLLLNEKMHEITSKSLSSALSIVNCYKLNENQIKCFCNFFNVIITFNLSKENAFLLMNILDNSSINKLEYNQQNRVSSFVLSCCINQSIYKQNDNLTIELLIEKVVKIFEKLEKINISKEFEKLPEIWKVLYQNHALNAISIFAEKCAKEFEQNIDCSSILKILKETIEYCRYDEIQYFATLFKNSTKLCKSFVQDSTFIEFCKSLNKILPKFQNDYLQIIQELIKLPEKPNNFYICLRGPLSQWSIFNHNQKANILLKMLNIDQIH